jgi:protein required for attachment to host cells
MSKTMWFVVADGAQARIFANEVEKSGLTLVTQLKNDKARLPGAKLGRDKPTRVQESANPARSANEPHVEPKQKEKLRFAHQLGGHVEEAAKKDKFASFVLVAPARAAREIRAALGKTARDRLIGVVNKDLSWVGDSDMGEHVKGFGRRLQRPRVFAHLFPGQPVPE